MLIYEFEELSGVQSERSDHEEEYLTGLSPEKQIKEGISPDEIQCKSSHSLIFKPSGQPACVKILSVQKLVSVS